MSKPGERRYILSHNGRTIIVHDYTNLSGAEYVEAIESNAKLSDQTDFGQRLILIDATNSIVSKEVVATFKRVSRNVSSKVSKIAVVGATMIQKIFVITIAAFSKTNMKSFDSHEEAKNWLTTDQ